MGRFANDHLRTRKDEMERRKQERASRKRDIPWPDSSHYGNKYLRRIRASATNWNGEVRR